MRTTSLKPRRRRRSVNAAGFAAILSKPFSLDELVETVARAVGRSEPFDHSRGAEEKRTSELVQALMAPAPPT